jgi:hypothetical protein
VQVSRAGRLVDVKRESARLPGETERPFRPRADNLDPLPPGQPLAGGQPDVAMEKSCRRLRAARPEFFLSECRC